MNFLEKTFKLTENGTTVKKELVAALTTFFTMAYILFVNPQILGISGMNPTSVLLATCIASAVGCFLMAFLANYPFALAPGMGLNAFFSFVVCGSMGISWQGALAAVFISGIIFVILTVTGARTAIVNAIPKTLKKAISAGIGMFIAYIGLHNTGIVNISGSVPVLNLASPMAILAIVGIVITVIMMAKNVKGGIFISIIATTVIGIVTGLIMGSETMGAFGIAIPKELNFNFDFSTFGAFATGFGDLFSGSEGLLAGILSLVSVLISFTMIDLFDTIGTLIGAADKGGFLDENGDLPRANKALMADAIATTVGAAMGTSTVTTFVESTSGISAGGKTGLVSMFVGIFFLLSILFTPILGMISPAATAPALVIVGVLMMSSLKDIDWDDFKEAAPAFFTILVMTVAYSISDGIAFGFFVYVVIQLFTGGAKKVHPVMYVVTLLFALRYVMLAV